MKRYKSVVELVLGTCSKKFQKFWFLTHQKDNYLDNTKLLLHCEGDSNCFTGEVDSLMVKDSFILTDGDFTIEIPHDNYTHFQNRFMRKN